MCLLLDATSRLNRAVKTQGFVLKFVWAINIYSFIYICIFHSLMEKDGMNDAFRSERERWRERTKEGERERERERQTDRQRQREKETGVGGGGGGGGCKSHTVSETNITSSADKRMKMSMTSGISGIPSLLLCIFLF